MLKLGTNKWDAIQDWFPCLIISICSRKMLTIPEHPFMDLKGFRTRTPLLEKMPTNPHFGLYFRKFLAFCDLTSIRLQPNSSL